MALISVKIGHIWLSFNVHFINADNPILIFIDDKDTLGIYLDNIDNTLARQTSTLNAAIVSTRGHSFITWNPHTSCFLTTTELQRLYRQFGHLSTEKLNKVLKRSGIDNVGADTRKLLKNIEKI